MCPPLPHLASAAHAPIRKLSPWALSIHRWPRKCLSVLPKGRLPGKVGTKFMATPGMAGGQPGISRVCAGASGFPGGGGWC